MLLTHYLDGTVLKDFTHLTLNRGDTYIVTNPISFSAKSVTIEAAGDTALPKPVLRLLNLKNGIYGSPFMAQAGTAKLILRGIRFDCPVKGFAIFGQWDSLLIEDCETLRGGLLQTSGPSTGTNIARRNRQLGQCDYWIYLGSGDGAWSNKNWLIEGNLADRLCINHTIRAYGIDGLTLKDNELCNLANSSKQALKVHDGQNLTITNTRFRATLTGQVVKIGPLPTKDSGKPGKTLTNVTWDSGCVEGGQVVLEAGVVNFKITNICINTPGGTGACISVASKDTGSPGSLPASGVFKNIKARYGDSTGRFAYGLHSGVTVIGASTFGAPTPVNPVAYP